MGSKRSYNNGPDVYLCLLDWNKAFDCIRYDKLLQKLISTGLLPVITRSLMNMYVNSQIQVRWKNAVSEPFGVTNGVKQGSVLFTILFTLCLKDLIVELEDNGDVCRIGMKYFGIVGFADVLKLLSPSLLGLPRMLNICKAFSTSTGLTFNAKKNLCIKFHHGHHLSEITQYTILSWQWQTKMVFASKAHWSHF